MTHGHATGRSRSLVAALVVASLTGGCAAPGPDPSGRETSTPAPAVTGTTVAPMPGSATLGTAGNPGGEGPAQPAEPSPATTTPAGPGGPAAQIVWVQPVHLLAPLRCFTEGLDTRYVEGYGSLAVDPLPYGEVEFFEQEYDSLTRITMNSVERRVMLLPDRRVPAAAGHWLVDIVIRMHLSGGFVINYNATHRAETGTFTSPEFTSPVDDTCTVSIRYAITTMPVS